VSGFLEEQRIRFAVIGGVALASYGLSRTTVDLDIVVEATAQESVIGFLESLGYQTVHRSPGYSNHVHPETSWGSFDCVYVAGETAEKLFAACRVLPGPGGFQVPVPKPEHLAAMKVLAMKNDPARTFQEMADLRFLVTLPGVDRAEVRGYFERYGLEERYEDIERTL
jgi:hypothetical protein